MFFRNGNYLKALVFLFIFLYGCQDPVPVEKTLINTQHLDNLYEEVLMAGDTVAFVYIYAEHPSYEPVVAPGEGIACIDDVARAAIFYSRYYDFTKNDAHLTKAKRLIKFILKLQAENGLFYNFIYDDFSINTTRHNSLPIPDWWTWRALWTLSEALFYIKDSNPDFSSQIRMSFEKAMKALNDKNQNGHLIKDLPADQASVFLMALAEYNRCVDDNQYFDQIRELAKNIISKQKGNANEFPYYAFLSWRNEWHGWGNAQAYALLKAGHLTGDHNMINAAQNEVKYFYPYVMQKNHFKRFVLLTDETDSKFEPFEQIAYAVRPMVWAALELYKIDNDEEYAKIAGKLASWFLGKNVAQTALYNPKSGICYDGINSAKEINMNSGAESTIEALLTLLEIEKTPVAYRFLKSASGIEN